MKRGKLKNRLPGTLFLVLGVLLILVSLFAVLMAFGDFDSAWHAWELYPWAVPASEPGWEDAMYTLEDRQFRWVLAGEIDLLLGLFGLAGGIFLARKGWKRRREGKT